MVDIWVSYLYLLSIHIQIQKIAYYDCLPEDYMQGRPKVLGINTPGTIFLAGHWCISATTTDKYRELVDKHPIIYIVWDN